MRAHPIIAIAAALALVACDSGPEEIVGPPAGSVAFDQPALLMEAAGEVAQGGSAGAGAQDAGALAQAGTLLAYRYGASFETPARNVRELMSAHERACRDAGVATCQILSANVSDNGPDYVWASLSMRAAPAWLTTFRAGLEGDARAAEGRVTSTSVTAEDLTRAIVDTEARLRAGRMLSERLEALLQAETKDVGDLLSVERELARVQGEIDSHQSQLEMMRRRVEMSTMDLSYASAPRPLTRNALDPLRLALTGFIGVLAESAGVVVTVAAAALPWLVIVLPALWLLRRWWRARRARKAAVAG